MTHLAFLRAINVGGRTVVKMAEVMADFRKLGIWVTRRGYLHARPPQDVLEHARKFYK